MAAITLDYTIANKHKHTNTHARIRINRAVQVTENLAFYMSILLFLIVILLKINNLWCVCVCDVQGVSFYDEEVRGTVDLYDQLEWKSSGVATPLVYQPLIDQRHLLHIATNDVIDTNNANDRFAHEWF